ncbi:MAG TPA: UDP-N-acetylmuramoyl-L-alanyl-D-glutamate--2,6-diaminopimelate ligase [Tepidisphaeraceae bacterium]|nr:UDP-N-acetylmuramoyl-L-alanyl-D-glutamate--2,6-diaminopimelate ligase [Tepidisphaeraceae bacterium]
MEVLVISLHELIRRVNPRIRLGGIPDVRISGIQEDSRLIRPGDLFIARPGTKADGSQFIADAQARGAVAVVSSKRVDGIALPQVTIEDPAAASVLANVFYGEPSASMRVVGVTGTNGKTTTTYLIRHLLKRAGIRCGLIGTVEIDDGKTRQAAEMTTPSATEVARLLAAMRDRGCRACAMETSSHALHQHRVSGVRFAAAAFTNLSGDHLDYHKTIDDYAAAKARLFEMLPPDAVACVNVDDQWSGRMIRDTQARVIGWGFASGADYRARDVATSSGGTHFVLVSPDGRTEVKMQLIGRHNVENALCAAAVVGEAFGLSVHQIAAGLSDAAGAPGRLQAVHAGQPFTVLVDYAHTDDALENVLSALRPLTRGRLRVVFGCGGDRDRSKRPRMARVAERLADVIYVTSDNPRTENPQAIIDEILSGFSSDTAKNGREGKNVIVEPDRRTAIQRVLADAESDDVVLIAGKGHEDYQIIGTVKHHFDDVEEATRALQARLSVGG